MGWNYRATDGGQPFGCPDNHAITIRRHLAALNFRHKKTTVKVAFSAAAFGVPIPVLFFAARGNINPY